MNAAERIREAVEDRSEASILVREGIGNKAALGKLYHAMLQSLFVLLDIRDIGRLTHADVIERFEREFLDRGRIGRNVGAVLRRTYDLTHECDCEHMPLPTDGEVEAAQRTAAELVKKAETYLTGGDEDEGCAL